MSNYPNQLDDDVSLPRVDDNITEVGGDAINALRDAVFALESEVGLGGSGTAGSIAARLGVSIDPAGNIKPSAIASIGLVTLPITDSQISATAGIKESKVALDYPTASLYNIINNVNTNLDTALNFIVNHGSKLEPHLQGITFRHVLNHIDVDLNVNNYFKNRNGLLRDNTNLYTLFNDVNKDLVSHEKANGRSFGTTDPTNPTVGTIPPANYAHVASGLYLNTANFSFVPQTATDLQQFAQFIDNSNIFILGTRIQTLYQNGVSRTSRSAIVTDNSHGQLIVPVTQVIAYHLASGSSSPVDSIDNGDDIIEFSPSVAVAATNSFDAQFSLVKVGDILTINYGSVTTQFIIRETKYVVNGSNKRYLVRIDGKNFLASTTAVAQINRPLFSTEKYGVLALAQAQPPTPIVGSLPTLITGNPRGAEVLGNGFNPDLLDSNHCYIYLVLYPDGNPASSSYSLAPIDVTGNLGATPGKYTLDSVVAATNAAFRTPGFNYRFIAFSYQGNFGLMLADSYGGASFSVISGIIGINGSYDQNLTNTIYASNVVDLFGNKDALGFGPSGSNVASPPFSGSFANTAIAQTPTKIFVPLTKKTFYVNGVERERLNVEPNQDIDGYGDGFWPAFIVQKQIIGSRVKVSYQVNRDLSTSGLSIGKTIVVQPESGSGTQVDFGRFFIENVQINSCNCDGYSAFTTITVYDGVHGTGITPYVSSAINTKIRLYFSGDSIGFNKENAHDQAALTVYKRHMEIFVNQDGYTFSQERGRINISGSTVTLSTVPLYSSTLLSQIHIYKISPKLRGYIYQTVTKINLQITSYNQITGVFSGYLCSYDGTNTTNVGPTVVGKKGQPVRFYDNTNVDYIDFIFDINDSISTISSTQYLDIQLFPTLSLDDEVMFLGTVEVADQALSLSYLRDERQFGNVSEKQLSTSALDYIAAPTRFLQENGIIRGFEITQIPNGISPYANTLSINGGVAIVNGKIIQTNNETIAIPVVQEVTATTPNNTITWFICVNDKAELELIASTDFDPKGVVALAGAYSGLDHTRMFRAQNPNLLTPVPYTIRGSYLADLVQNQKDVTVIGTITTTISLVSAIYYVTAAVAFDARRYVYNGYGGLDNPFILGTNASFRNFNSLNTWINQLTQYESAILKGNSVGKKVIVKGNYPITTTTTLNYLDEIIFEGDGGIFTISNDIGFAVGNNVKFKNVRFDYLYDPSGDSSFNTAYLANPTKAAVYCNVDPTLGAQNITFENCTFTTPNQYHFGFIGFNFATAACRAQNITIVNNKFKSSFAGEDKQAVITFAGPVFTPGSTQLTGARLINCFIQNNICDKNQMIMVSSLPDTGTGLILDAIVGVNLKISSNTCGSINVLVKRDIPSNVYNATFSLDKLNETLIVGNVCRFIYSGFGNGSMIDGSNNRAVAKIATGIFTGTLIISDNACSYIHTGYRVSNTVGSLSSSLIIKNNKLRAYDSTATTGFLNSYYSGFTLPGNTQTATALIVDKVLGA